MRRLITSLTLICILLVNVITSPARNNYPKSQKSRVERKSTKDSVRKKSESRRESATRRQALKRNPRLAAVLKGGPERDLERTDQPREALEWYLQKRLPKGEKQLPVERYFEAKEKIKHMKRFSTRGNKNLPSQADAGENEILDSGDGEFPNGTGGGGAGDGSA